MTTPPRPITVRCPRCSHEFKAWWRASWNEDVSGPLGDEELEEMSMALIYGRSD